MPWMATLDGNAWVPLRGSGLARWTGTRQRREQNAAHQAAQELVVDSLLNFETVKLLACERVEAERFNRLTTNLARLQTTSQDSLSWLNWGQTATMQLGMLGGLLVACWRTAARQSREKARRVTIRTTSRR